MLKWQMCSAVTIVGIAVTTACAGSRNVESRLAACPLTPRDSAFLGGGPVYRDCAVDSKAKLILNSVRNDYRPTARTGNNCYAVEVRMVVDTTGKTEPATVELIRTNDRGFADAVLADARTWRFEPAMLDHKPVRQIATEKRTIATMTVVVPAGQSPSRSQATGRRPTPSC
jgi:hypothetical protein